MHAELAAVPDSLYNVTRANRVIASVTRLKSMIDNPYQAPRDANRENDEVPTTLLAHFASSLPLFFMISGFIAFMALGNGGTDRAMINMDLLESRIALLGIKNRFLLAAINAILIGVVHALIAALVFRFVPKSYDWHGAVMLPLSVTCLFASIVL